jgi:tripartite-type tricarboxylate transporter receptor subunit TctC
MEFLNQRFGLRMTHVPYNNTGQAISDTVAGHVDLGFVEAGASLPVIRDGKLRALAVSSLARLPLLPNIPPLAEVAGAPDFEAVSWHLLCSPAKTPLDIVTLLHDDMKEIMDEPDIKQQAASIGLVPIETPPVEAIRSYIKAEREKWGGLVKALGLEGTE